MQCVTISAPEQLESSQSPHTSAKAMLFVRWQHYLRLCSCPLCPVESNGNENFRV